MKVLSTGMKRVNFFLVALVVSTSRLVPFAQAKFCSGFYGEFLMAVNMVSKLGIFDEK
jgi:hypothetical protein